MSATVPDQPRHDRLVEPALEPDAITHVFVYGTLRPGDVRWPILSPFVAGEGFDDAVGGDLFDTGLDYPAAIFGTGGTIVGRTYPLLVESLARCLDVLDIEEDTVLGLYRRVHVRTHRGVDAWAYQYGTGLDLVPIPSGDWFRRDRADAPLTTPVNRALPVPHGCDAVDPPT